MLGAQGAGVDFTDLPLPALRAEVVKLAHAIQSGPPLVVDILVIARLADTQRAAAALQALPRRPTPRYKL